MNRARLDSTCCNRERVPACGQHGYLINTDIVRLELMRVDLAMQIHHRTHPEGIQRQVVVDLLFDQGDDNRNDSMAATRANGVSFIG